MDVDTMQTMLIEQAIADNKPKYIRGKLKELYLWSITNDDD